MKKSLIITLIVLGVIIGIIGLDTMQAKLFNNSPIVKIREYLSDSNTYIDKGLFVNYYNCNNEKITTWKKTKYACPMEETKEVIENNFNEELFSCLESELGAYLVGENDDLIEIPLSEIKTNDTDKIAYYKGVYASEHPDNIYVMVYPKNGTYDVSVMKDFEKYFYEKFKIYQTYSSSTSPNIYIHSAFNDVDFKSIMNKCQIKNKSTVETPMPDKISSNLKDTTKIVIKMNKKELGTIDDKKIITQITEAISSSKRYGDICLSDGHSFDLEMFDNQNKLLDTIYIWQDGNRVGNANLGCYYHVTNGTDFRTIIENVTDYVFYNIIDERDNESQKLQLIYQDNQFSYYLKSDNPKEILIKFSLNNQIMTLKYALENKYISAEKVANEYPDILIKK